MVRHFSDIQITLNIKLTILSRWSIHHFDTNRAIAPKLVLIEPYAISVNTP